MFLCLENRSHLNNSKYRAVALNQGAQVASFQPCWAAAEWLHAPFLLDSANKGIVHLKPKFNATILRFQAPPVICRTWQEPKQAQFLCIKLEATCGVFRTEVHLCSRNNIIISVSHQDSLILFFFPKSRVHSSTPRLSLLLSPVFYCVIFFLNDFYFFSKYYNMLMWIHTHPIQQPYVKFYDAVENCLWLWQEECWVSVTPYITIHLLSKS